MSSTGVGPQCFIKSRVNAAVYQEVLEHFMVPSADNLYGDADFIFPAGFGTCPHCQKYQYWFNEHGITVLDWPANSPDLHPIENLWDIVKRKMRDTRHNNADELKATIRATWAVITPQQCHRLIASMPRHIDAVINVKGAPTKFNPLKALQPKRRLQQILASSPVPVPKPESGSGTAASAATAPVAIPVPAPPAFDYCRFIELDYVPMETGYMVSMRPTKGYTSTKSPTKGYASTKRTPAAPSNRDPYGNTSLSSSSNSGSCKGSDCSPTKGRHQKYTSCTDNHGIRPPPPEQYLTPLQQKEVCIRHLRARLKETITTLQDRDTEIDELRGQLYRMQEDWVEEECHRVEAQLALKDARQEIQQLKQAVDTVRARLSEAGGLSGDIGVQKYFQDINTQNHKLENLLLSMEIAQAGLAKEGEGIPGCRIRVGGSAPASVSGESPGAIPKPAVGGRGSCSCDGSPARSLTRSSTYTKLSDQALADRNGNGPDFPCLSGDGTQDSGFGCGGESSVPSRADLLLEAAFLSEETASLLNSYAQMPHSSTYEKLCTGERMAPFRCGLGGVSCMSHPCLSHHHLYLHPLRETGIQTESCPIPAAGYPSDLDTIAEQRTFRSQACSPTSTWMSDEGEEELDSITTTTSVTTATVMSTATEPIPVSKTPLVPPLPRSATVACSMESPLCEKGGKTLENLNLEDRHQEVDRLAGSTQTDTAELSPSHPRPSPGIEQPHTSQPKRSTSHEEIAGEDNRPRKSTSHEEIAGVIVVEVHDSEDDDEDETKEQGATGGDTTEQEDSTSGQVQKSYWSRHFLVDLLAVAIPMVPTVAWLCRGPVRGRQPIYHIGSLLRGCCTVALHSLRRGGGLRHYPAGGGDMGGSQI
ncbi:syntaphilin [Scomber japonicus]|uniref:syntaphilin n=1 Tax=Scomber japonicus TaxID=13676 RepID=UPI0023050BCE|nr:syntaphilin [Scomber japonicus]